METKKSRRSDNEAVKKEEKQPLTIDSDDSTLSFDVFFQGLLRLGKVQKHHRLPMKKYVESKGIMDKASREAFEQILKTY